MDMYRELILDHYKHPHNYGSMSDPSATGQAYNTTCGDKLVMQIIVNDKKTISDIRFSGVGCAISLAAASMLTDTVKGMPIAKALMLTASDILDMLGSTLTPSRTKCATLSLEVLHTTIMSLKK